MNRIDNISLLVLIVISATFLVQVAFRIHIGLGLLAAFATGLVVIHCIKELR